MTWTRCGLPISPMRRRLIAMAQLRIDPSGPLERNLTCRVSSLALIKLLHHQIDVDAITPHSTGEQTLVVRLVCRFEAKLAPGNCHVARRSWLLDATLATLGGHS